MNEGAMNAPQPQGGSKKQTIRCRIATILAEEILANPRPEDYALSSENQLCRRFEASRVTIRHALSDLEHRGLVYRRQGRGTFARGQSTRLHRDLAVLASPDALKLHPLHDLIRGIQSVLAPLGSSLVLINSSPTDWRPESAARLGGVLIVQDGLSSREVADLKIRQLPFLRLRERWFSREDHDFFQLGQRAAQALNHAAATSETIDPREWNELERPDGPPRDAPVPADAHASRPPGPSWLSVPKATLQRVLKLLEKRETIQARIDAINRKLAVLETAPRSSAVRPPHKPPGRHPPRRMTMKEAILARLRAAGEESMSIPDIAAAIGCKASSVSVWIYTSGKAVPGLKRTGRGRFTYSAGGPGDEETPPAHPIAAADPLPSPSPEAAAEPLPPPAPDADQA